MADYSPYGRKVQGRRSARALRLEQVVNQGRANRNLAKAAAVARKARGVPARRGRARFR